ncbi:MAG: ornithine carbamoyltransferase, partial [Betaproteobacteria bacterium]|nr:ornithine carbamoyltransferase [Betaproteobacteria bacterium]
SNAAASIKDAQTLLGFKLRIAAPQGYRPSADVLDFGGDAVKVVDDPQEAVAGADCVLTDVWASMGDEDQKQQRQRDLAAYQVDARLMAKAAPEAIFMHCLPAHRGEEVTAEVIDSPASAVWREAENRLHTQKALLEMLIR